MSRKAWLIASVSGLLLVGLANRSEAQTSAKRVYSHATYPSGVTEGVVPTTASQSVTRVSTSVCPKCGKVHGASPASVVPGTSQSSVVAQTSYSAPAKRTSLRASGGVQNVLSTLNAQRARQGIGALRYDPALQAVANRRAQTMAASGLKSHPPGSFAPGTYEGVGWSSSYSPSGVSACFTSDRRMVAAGAAMATGRDGVYFAVVYR